MHTNLANQDKSTNLFFIITFSVLAIIGAGLLLQRVVLAKKPAPAAVADQNLKTMTPSELSAFDGTNPDKPIYLGYEGNVYDITAGKDYYVVGGTYHYLAGKDSTSDLHIAGGDIIKRKYPIIARLAQ